MRRLLLAFALASLPLAVQAQGKPDPKLVPAGTYAVDGSHTQVVFTVTHLGFSEYSGQFTQPSGNLTLDPKNPSNDKVDITFPIQKVSTTVPALDAHLQKPEFFDAAKYPIGRFVSTSVTVKGLTAIIKGDLTLKGVTKPVTLTARFIGAGANPLSKSLNFGFQATTIVKRSEFGVSYGIPMVSDDVRLTINAAFQPE